MRRIGLTQRVFFVSARNERCDMLDQRWSDLIGRIGGYPVPLANRVQDLDGYLESLALDALVLTGGNDIATLPGATSGAPERDHFEAAAYRYFLLRNKPILGVCRGAQMINHLEGGRLMRVNGHVGVHHALIWSDVAPQYWGRPTPVNSYHDWAIPPEGLAAGMEALAWGPDGMVEAFRAVHRPVSAILWHPERVDKWDPESLALLTVLLGMRPPEVI